MSAPRIDTTHFKGLSAALLAGALAAIALLAIAPAAQADLSFCPFGSGAGQCDSPEGVAIDPGAGPNGHVYVVDRNNNRIDVFDTAGAFVKAFGWGVADGVGEAPQSCTATCFKGIAGSGAGQLSGAQSIAVDEASHDVYVNGDHRIQKFDSEGNFILTFGLDVNKTKVAEAAPEAARSLCTLASGDKCGAGVQGKEKCQLSEIDAVAVGPGGVVYVDDWSRIGLTEAEGFKVNLIEFEPGGSCIERLTVQEGNVVSPSIAVDSTGDFYLRAEGGIGKYDPSGNLLYVLDKGIELGALAVDSADRLFAFQGVGASKPASGFSYRVISVYDSAGNGLRRFGFGGIELNLRGLAPFHNAAGDVFASEENGGSPSPGNRVIHLPLPPPGPIVPPSSVDATSVANTKATLEAEIDPEGKATEYRFEYVDDAHFKEAGFASPATKKTAPTPLGSEDIALHYVKATIGCQNPVIEAPEGKCLEPETTYHFRLVATNPDGPGEGTVSGVPFPTEPLFKIDALYATEPGTDSARLQVELNPLGLPTTGFFEYVDDASFQESGFEEATEVPDVSGGEAPIDFGSGEAFVNRDASLSPLAPGTTYHYRLVASDPLVSEASALSPERTYTTFALSSPESCSNDAFRAGAGAILPDCRAYEMVSPLDKNNGDILALEEFFHHVPSELDQSSLSGDRFTYSSYRAFGDAQSAPFNSQYLATRTSGGWSNEAIAPPEGAPLLFASSTLETGFRAFSPDLCQAWVRTVYEPTLAPGAIEGFLNLYRRDNCGEGGYLALTTAPPAHESKQPFPAEHYSSLELQGVAADGAKALYAVTDNLTADAPNLGAKQLQLYEWDEGQTRFVCILPNGQASPKGCSAGGAADADGKSLSNSFHNAISADGQRVFWTAAGGEGAGPGQIYVRIGGEETLAVSKQAEEETGSKASTYRSAAADGSKAIFTTEKENVSNIYEFEVETKETRLIAHKFVGLVGASEDASRLYFVSKEALSGEEENEAGAKAEAGEPNLYFYEAGAGGGAGSYRFIATLRAADVPGVSLSSIAIRPFQHIARVSPDGLHAVFSSSGSLTGYDNADATNGKADAELFVYDAAASGGAHKLICASCNPTGVRPVGVDVLAGILEFWVAAHIPAFDNVFHGARALSDDGRRLFFESSDVLSPRDANGVSDVYEWEAQGTGSCTSESTGFAPASAGCISLISSGQSKRDSEIVDATPSGEDVFIRTLSSLLPQDYGLIDIYDARANGGLPTPPPPRPQCEGDGCQSPAQAPNDPTPASASFRGAGDPVAKKKHQAKKKHHAKKRHAKKRSHAKRRAGR